MDAVGKGGDMLNITVLHRVPRNRHLLALS
jgi:hypothetical protein